MPRLLIDTIPVEVPDGTSILEAARKAGITIPHFCWHPALGRAGACRVCAVKILEGPVRGIQMSCMVPAQEGMVVSTTDEEAAALRRSVIEWLMINHPHDCPVCDEGGECQLQDFTIAGGHGIRRYNGRKRTHANQYLGEFIEHEMNRCIQCYRCVRFYQEYAGGTDFGVLGRADMVYFGRQCDGPLESPYSGNLVDICPTGVFTDKSARFRARYWDYDMAPSVCPHCSLGCNTIPMARYRELLKTVARRNDTVNGWFICDRGRFANGAVNAAERPRQALVDGQPVSMETALDALAGRIGELLELHGPDSLAICGSPRMSLEGNIMAARLRDLTDAGTICYFGDPLTSERTLEAVSLLTQENAASQADVRGADMVAIMACNLLDEAPMMALAVRQAWRNGARIYMVNPVPCPGGKGNELPFAFTSVATPGEVPFREATRPVVISGALRAGLDDMRTMMANGAKPALILDGPNTFGCAILARQHAAIPLAEALAGGRVRGIISLEADLPDKLPEGVRLLAVADWRATPHLSRAEIVLPATAWAEMDGTFVNNEGRAQRFKKVMDPGLPIKGLTPELHPPRVHSHDAPGGDTLPAWRIVSELMARLEGKAPEPPLTGPWRRLATCTAEQPGVSMLPERIP